MENWMHMLPILAVGVFAGVVIIDRIYNLYFRYPLTNAAAFMERIRDLVLSHRMAEAIAFCDQFKSKPIAQVVKSALLRADQPDVMIEDEVAVVASQSLENINRRTSFLSTAANVATLLGLLGTILGLIHSFEAVSVANAQQRAALLAAGISTAMNATMLGLGVAIPCMVAFSFLMNRANRLAGEVERASVRTVDILRQVYLQPKSQSPTPSKVVGLN